LTSTLEWGFSQQFLLVGFSFVVVFLMNANENGKLERNTRDYTLLPIPKTWLFITELVAGLQ